VPSRVLALALFAVLGQLWIQPAHILHHLEDGACESHSTTTHDECSQCAVYHSGTFSVPEVEFQLHTDTVEHTVLEALVVPAPRRMPGSVRSRAPPLDLL
jgi:hypothetical protein